MKKQHIWPLAVTAGILAVGTGTSTWADDKPPADTKGQVQTPAATHSFMVAKASELKGMDVHNQSGQKLGDVKDSIIDLHSGRIAAVLVGAGGVLGIGEKLHPVPPQSFVYTHDPRKLVLNADKETFKNGPTWELRHHDFSAFPTIYQHYGHKWSDETRMPVRGTDVDKAAREAGREVRETERDLPREARETARDVREAAKDTARNLRGDQPAWMEASKIIGRDVENPANEDLGDIKDLVLDLKAGKVLYAVLEKGGLAGVGGDLYAIPPQQLAFSTAGRDKFILSTSKDKLEQAPKLDKDEWSNLNDANWANRVYSHYGESPYWMPGTSPDTTREPVRGRVDEPQNKPENK